MNKVYRINEKQFNNVMSTLKKEREVVEGSSNNDSKYKMKCTIDLEHAGLTYHGNEVDDISTHGIDVTFDIDMEGREWGIKDVSVYNVSGPSELELNVIYYPQGSDDNTDETITVPLNWDNVNYEENSDLAYIGIDSSIIISLKNDDNGGLMVDTITVERKSI